MAPQAPLREPSATTRSSSSTCRSSTARRLRQLDVKGSQFLAPLFEFSGACAGCGETPYLKLAHAALRRPRVVANATGCSSIYGGNLPTTPWTANRDGRGPAWSNSLFEDNAEFGLGMRLALDSRSRAGARPARDARRGRSESDARGRDSSTPTRRREAGIAAQRERVATLKRAGSPSPLDPRHGCSRAGGRRPGRARASGSWAATAGPTTSASAASTTCCRCATTSTCWCSTRRSTPTPAASSPRPRPSARPRSSRSAARRPARRTSA